MVINLKASEFIKIYDSVLKESADFWKPDVMKERMKDFLDENGKMDQMNTALFLEQQGVRYTNLFVRNLLFDLLVDEDDLKNSSESIK